MADIFCISVKTANALLGDLKIEKMAAFLDTHLFASMDIFVGGVFASKAEKIEKNEPRI